MAYDRLKAWPPGRHLDIPSKEGAIPSRLSALGFRSFCGDIDLGIFKADVPAVKLDLNRPFPFAAESFDYVTFIEGIEHIERPFDALGEVWRVLRPGGRLILSTPNILNLRSRLRFLLAGHHLRFREIRRGGHILALSYRELQYFLTAHGFEIVEITTDRARRKWGPLHLLLRLLSRRYTRRYNPFAAVVNSDSLTGGRTIMIVAVKRLAAEARGRPAVPPPPLLS